MAEKLHLLRRGGVWWFQWAVPRALHGHPAFGGKRIISQSLKTGDLATARAERNRLVGELQGVLDRVQSGMVLTDSEIAVMAAAARERIEAQNQARAAAIAAMGPLTDDQRRGLGLRIPRKLEPGEQWGDFALKQNVGADIEAIAAERNAEIPLYSDEWRRIAVPLAAAKGLTITARKKNPPAPSAQAVEPEASSDETISQAAEIYIKELRHKKKTIGPDAIALRRKAARLFVSYTGDATMSSVTVTQAKDFMNRITRFSPTWRGDTFAQIEKLHTGGEQRLSVLTTNTYAAVLKAMFRSAMRRGTYRGNLNPFDDLHQAGAQAESYEAFEIDELNKLFADAKFLIKPKHHDYQTALPWLALLGLYSGARLQELAQLNVADIREEHGVTVLDIHAKNGNKLKSKSAERLIPLHSAVIDAGFMKYVAALPKGGKLFPGLKGRASHGGKVGTNVGESFGRWRKRVGLTRKGLAFHSLRHNVTQALERAGAHDSDIARVLGHRQKGISLRVYSKPQLGRVVETVEVIGYPGLKLV